MKTLHFSLKNAVIFLMLCCCFTVQIYAQQPQTLTAKSYYDRISGNPNLEKNPKGESFCWHAASGMGTFVNMYEATGDKSWLDYGIKYYDLLVSNLDSGPDGYKGWIGPYMYDTQYWCDVHVGDAILWRGILDFAVLVLNEKSLKADYGKKAREYVGLARKHCVEKWDKRGTWFEDGPYGAYVSYDKYLDPGDLSGWKHGAEVNGSNLSLPFNKQNDMAQVCILLYRITGEDFYRDRAEKIFSRMKRCFQYFGNHYVWNYWEPFGLWDIDRENNKPRHWVGVHPYRNYQAGEVDQIVDAYHTGIVFDETDIRRIINTNLKIMWNGDMEHPRFRNSNITHVPEKKPPEGSGYTSSAGTLWTGLLDFDQTVRDLYALRFDGSETNDPSQIYFEQVIRKTPPDFRRKYVKGTVRVPAVEFTECPDLNMAVVIPHIIPKGTEALIVCKSWSAADTLEIALYSKDGARKVRTLNTTYLEGGGDGLAGIYIFPWDRTDSKNGKVFPGDYRVRWTFCDSYREYPVTLK
ncbi:MAG: hypothetical protein JXB48_15280 [Candidatus Latescibacteria bacterium]|nr:hypothetical protein [Candidatus Latescibacterota bacterium]